MGLTTSVCTVGKAREAVGVLRGCLGFLQTNTYQAVLTTDGNRSFALLLYQDGRMQWDYTELAAGNVLMGFSRCRVCDCIWDSRDFSQRYAGTIRDVIPGRPQLPPPEQPCPI